MAMSCAWYAASRATAQPFNDACASATPVQVNSFVVGSAAGATSDGSSTCSPAGLNVPDVYHTFRAGAGGLYTFSLCQGTLWDTVLSVHSFCPATAANQLECNDEACRPASSPTFGWPSAVTLYLAPQSTSIIRISGYDLGAGFNTYRLNVTGPATPTGACCIANVCTLQTAATCGLAGGAYFGDLSACLTTARAPRSYALTTGVPSIIPDNLPAGLTRTITVPDSFTVGSLRLTLSLSHTWAGDLTIRLAHAGRTATIVQKLRGGQLGTSTNLLGQYVFSDDAVRSLWDTSEVIADTNSLADIPAGLYWATDAAGSPVSLAQTFAGVPAAGDWTLTIVDSAQGDFGTLSAFSLSIDESFGDICTTPPPPSGACCLGAPQGGLGPTCGVYTQAACASNQGNFRGSGTTCGPSTANPTTCCTANFNQQSGVTVQDIFDYLAAWFAGSSAADFNGLGGVSVQDIFDYLAAWFVGCRVV